MANFASLLSEGFGAITIAFLKSWKLSLASLLTLPLMISSFAVTHAFLQSGNSQENRAYQESANIVQEILYSIPTVLSFNAQKLESKRYAKSLSLSERLMARKGLIVGFSYAFSMLGITSLFLVIVQYGTTLYLENELGLQHVYTTFFLIIIGSLSLGQLSTYYVDFNECDQSCDRLFGI